METVTWAMVPGTRTAVLRLEEFSHGAADELKAALGEIKTAGADRVVFDLRGNPGGYVDEAVGVASQFLASGDVFVERDASGKETSHPVSPGGAATDLPLVVLIDGGTASSAEIVSGAIQDAGRAELIGVKTFGTGTVLGEFALADGSALRVGTVEWLTPKGRRIWHEGIAPDVAVERADDVAPIVPDDLRAMTAAEAAAPDRPAARPGRVGRRVGRRARVLGGPRGPQPASERQVQVISAMSGVPGSTMAGPTFRASGGAVCGSTHRASSGTV